MNASIFKTWIVATALIALIGLAPNSAKAGLIVPGTEQAHLEFANDPMFQSVGWLLGTDATGKYITGSAVLISPEWVLTAAHALDFGYSAVSFSLDPVADKGASSLHAADAWYMHPNFVNDGGDGTTDDIALIHLSVPIVGVVPADIYWGDIPAGTHGYWAGYGRLAYETTGEIPPAGTKRGGENLVDSIGSDLFGVHDQFFLADWAPTHHTTLLPLEMNGTNGDSGGGWFADMGDGYQLVGLTAFGKGVGVLTQVGAIRPAVYQDWIETYVPPASVPEPSSALLLATLLPFVARRFRKELPERFVVSQPEMFGSGTAKKFEVSDPRF